MKKLKRFTAQWCQPCKTLTKNLESLDLTDVEVEVIDVDTFDKLKLQNLGVRGVPTLILQDSEGNEIKRKTGSMTTQQLKIWLENT